ncbi:MAG: TIGR00303 family protein [Thermoproteota archaeon]|nr:TIGR00303 family protein [Thermoproteota archaeon]
MHDITASFDGPSAVKSFATKNPVFVCVISYTATSEISGLTAAGANAELVKYTSPADAEFLYYGRCSCIDVIPATPDGKPTPALITRTALQLATIPLLVVDAGAKVKPSIPYISLGVEPGRNIVTENAMDISSVKRAFEHGELLGKQLAIMSDLTVLGESIPGGTTTALAVLRALGIDGRFKVSSSMPENPHSLKNTVVDSAIKRVNDSGIKMINSPFEAISAFGDPMMPSVAGIASGVLTANGKVMLAGGTQMAAVVAILNRLGRSLNGLYIGTTTYVTKDPSSDLSGLVRMASGQVPILSCDLHLDESSKPGLQAFAKGFVKEGAGAGGASIAAIAKSRGKITGKKLLNAIEKEYEISVETARR